MKSTKILLAAFASLFLVASCEKTNGPTGTVAVGFKSAEIETGLGAEYIYIPLSVAGDATAYPCTVNIEVKEYSGSFAAKEDVDYIITSKDIVVASAESKPSIEIRILNPEDADELRFALDIKGASVSSEMVASTLIRCAKSELDRVCGTYSVVGTSDGAAYSEKWKISNDNGAILISGIYGEKDGLVGTYKDGVVSFELGGENTIGAYNFTGIGEAYVAPAFGYYLADDDRFKVASGTLVGKVSEDFKSIVWQIKEPYGLILAVYSYDDARTLLGVYQPVLYIKDNTITKVK